MAGSCEEAEELIQKHRPNLIFCDYQIGNRFGLDLLQKQRQEYPKLLNQCLFILVTGNTSQSAVAQAAEEDVDAYILKPYTLDSFSASVFRTIQAKVEPGDYLKMLQKGKDLLELNLLDESIQVFEKAISLNLKPSLAYYYLGQAQYRQGRIQEAEVSYQKGLCFNPVHYKCLVGLFDLLMAAQKYEAAYEVVQKIVQVFPANPKRLSLVLKLAIQTKHFEDVDQFYQEFRKIDERNDELVRSVCAALIVCGKHFLENGDAKTGLDLIHKASISAAGRHFILKKAIDTLVFHDQLEDAKGVLKRFASPTEEDPHYAVASLTIAKKELKPEFTAMRGQDLLKKGILELEIYQITIESLEKYGLKERADELREKAVRAFPLLGSETKEQ
jgi:tetratricopeptide (TPR) repeat protein